MNRLEEGSARSQSSPKNQTDRAHEAPRQRRSRYRRTCCVVSITSNCEGFTSIALLRCDRRTCVRVFTLGYTALIAVTVRRQSCELASTLALSTEHSCGSDSLREQTRKSQCAQSREWNMTPLSHERSLPASVLCPRSPKYIRAAMFADDFQVQIAQALRLQRRHAAQRFEQPHWTYIHVQAHALTAKRADRLLRPLAHGQRIPFRTAKQRRENTASPLRQASIVALGNGVPVKSIAVCHRGLSAVTGTGRYVCR